MKKILFLLFLFPLIVFSQKMPDIHKVWQNGGIPYKGSIQQSDVANPISVTIEKSQQNPQDSEEYSVSGVVELNGSSHPFTGILKVKNFKNKKNELSVFGNYEFSESFNNSSIGIYKGKFTFKMGWDAETNQPTDQTINFVGKWKSTDGKTISNTTWNN